MSTLEMAKSHVFTTNDQRRAGVLQSNFDGYERTQCLSNTENEKRLKSLSEKIKQVKNIYILLLSVLDNPKAFSDMYAQFDPFFNALKQEAWDLVLGNEHFVHYVFRVRVAPNYSWDKNVGDFQEIFHEGMIELYNFLLSGDWIDDVSSFREVFYLSSKKGKASGNIQRVLQKFVLGNYVSPVSLKRKRNDKYIGQDNEFEEDGGERNNWDANVYYRAYRNAQMLKLPLNEDVVLKICYILRVFMRTLSDNVPLFVTKSEYKQFEKLLQSNGKLRELFQEFKDRYAPYIGIIRDDMSQVVEEQDYTLEDLLNVTEDSPLGNVAIDVEVLEKVMGKAMKSAHLTKRQIDTIIRRFGMWGHDQLTLAEIGEELAISGEMVRSCEVRALRKLFFSKEARALLLPYVPRENRTGLEYVK